MCPEKGSILHIFHFSQHSITPLSYSWRHVSGGNWRHGCYMALVRVPTPHFLIYLVLPPWALLPYLSSSPTFSLSLPLQLSLTACEVINGFHLMSSPTLHRAPTNKTRANTQIVPQKSSKRGNYRGCEGQWSRENWTLERKTFAKVSSLEGFLLVAPLPWEIPYC